MSRALQRTIHVACRELGIESDDRRALQLEVCGKTSMSDMTAADLKKVLERLKKDGFKGASKAPKKRPAASRADLRLIHVLWGKLGAAGVLDRPGRDGLNAFIRARFGETWEMVPADVDMLRDHSQIDAVISALKDWGKRAGIDFNWSARK